MNGTGQGPQAAKAGNPPVDVETIKKSANEVLADGAQIADSDEIETTILLLRGMIMLLIPDVETLAMCLPEDDIPRACALACLGEARMRLRVGSGGDLPRQIAQAQRLARSAISLSDHHVNLGGGSK